MVCLNYHLSNILSLVILLAALWHCQMVFLNFGWHSYETAKSYLAIPTPLSSAGSVPPPWVWLLDREPALPWSSSEIRPLTARRGSLAARLPPRLRLNDCVDQDPGDGACCCCTGLWTEFCGTDGFKLAKKNVTAQVLCLKRSNDWPGTLSSLS